MSKQLEKAFGSCIAHNVDSIASDEHNGPKFYPNSYRLIRFYETEVNSSEQGEFLFGRRVTRQAYADRFVSLTVIPFFSSCVCR